MPSIADIQIRDAAEADAPAIAICLSEAFAQFQTAYTPLAFADTVPTIAGVQLRLKEMHVLVAAGAVEIVGTISAMFDGEHGHLRGMAVLPEWRGTGVASLLLAAIENWLRAHGCRQVTLGTTELLRAALAFYEKNGFRRTGVISDFFGMSLIEYEKSL
jgi:GNAT superfamily N-acetyltransferase